MSNTNDELIEIPANVLVGCPLKKGVLTPVQKCPGCMFFSGRGRRFETDDGLPFAATYTLKCSHPVNRPMMEVDA